MFQDNLISEVNSTKAKTHIHRNIYLDYQYTKGKQPLKISINLCNQPKKALKSDAISQNEGQDQSKTNIQVEQQIETKYKKVGKKKKAYKKKRRY